ncbi:uncharacterized [Tachysurus ichikawai]
MRLFKAVAGCCQSLNVLYRGTFSQSRLLRRQNSDHRVAGHNWLLAVSKKEIAAGIHSSLSLSNALD